MESVPICQTRRERKELPEELARTLTGRRSGPMIFVRDGSAHRFESPAWFEVKVISRRINRSEERIGPCRGEQPATGHA